MNSTDTKILKARHDLRQIVEQDLGPSPARSARASLWKCPLHGERKGYSLAVWSDGFCCFGKCQVHGDVFDWLRLYRRLDFLEAVRLLDGEPPNATASPPSPPRPALPDEGPPPLAWQALARQVVDRAQAVLWSAQGKTILDYLTGRGLTLDTIRAARLGWVPGDRAWYTVGALGVPCGITIPWLTGGDAVLWAVKVRRLAGGPKYTQIAGGSSGGLYGADRLRDARVALFCEGEFDALLAHQQAGALAAAVTLGSAGSRLHVHWLADLVRIPRLLAAYDADEAGEKGADALRALSRRVRRVTVPWGKDLSGYHTGGGNVYEWLEGELRRLFQESSPERTCEH